MTTMKHKIGKKGVLDNLADMIQGLGALAILGAVIFLIIASTKTAVLNNNPCDGGLVYNTSGYCSPTGNATDANYTLSITYQAVTKTQVATSDIPNWLPIVVITIIGGTLLMLVKMFKNENG
jgi:hypothetical protein